MRRIVQVLNSVAGIVSNILLTIVIAGSVLLSCSVEREDNADTPPAEYPETPHSKVSIAHLKSLCRTDRVVITDDISIEGHIIVNDLYGEFIKSIVVADESGCLEVSVDCTSTAEIFFVGARMVVSCSSLALGDYGGRIILGAATSDEYSVGRVAEKDFSRYFLIDTSKPKEITPQVTKISNIDATHIGNYIELRDVRFIDGGAAEWCDKDTESGEYVTTERTITDPAGNEFTVRTLAECTYRNETLPQEVCTLRGIVDYFNGQYSLRVINHQIVTD